MDVDGTVCEIWQLQELVQKGFLRARWLIKSPGGSIVGEIKDIQSVPEIAVDEGGAAFPITFNNIEVVYSVSKGHYK